MPHALEFALLVLPSQFRCMIHCIELRLTLLPMAIGSFLVETDEGPVMVECGPHSTYEQLKAGVEQAGFSITDIKHLLLTHIHFDHAGAAWAIAKEAGAKVYVHPVGYPHVLDPEKLYNSAKRIYMDQMEPLWGKMEKIPAEQLIQVQDKQTFEIGGKSFIAHDTPGHAYHHIAWEVDGAVFCGDVGGARIDGGPIVPPCPPPEINIDAWKLSIDRLREIQPKELYVAHFGKYTDVDAHLKDLEFVLDDWAAWVKPHFEAGKKPQEVAQEFTQRNIQLLKDRGISQEGIDRYEAANPSYMSVAGLMRYWKLKAEGRI